MRRQLFTSVIVMALVTSCSVGPKYTPPEAVTSDQWKHACPQVAAALPKVDNWWQVFNDRQLHELEVAALRQNLNTKGAFERVLQARALAGVASADTLPKLTLEPSYQNQEIFSMLYLPVRVTREHRRCNQIPLVLNYEVDLWGKLRNGANSAEFAAEAEEETYNAALLTLTTDLALNYFELRKADAELELLERALESRKNACDVTQNRYDAKLTNSGDVHLARHNYSTTYAQYYEVQRERNLLENRIAVLTGMLPSQCHIAPTALCALPPVIPTALPSTVLLQRPDVRAAERRMASLHSKINVAYASYFPSLSLTGAIGYSSPELKDFLSWISRAWSFGASSSLNVYDGGGVSDNVKLATAQFREADYTYQQLVLNVFREVEDSLTNLNGLQLQHARIEEAVEEAHSVTDVARSRYALGLTFYLEVSSGETQELDAQRRSIQLLGDRYAATIQCIKALGGQW